MDGVILAEMYAKSADSVKVEDRVFEYAFGPEFYTVLVAGNERATISYPLDCDDFAKGVRDYLNYFEGNKEILSKGLDG